MKTRLVIILSIVTVEAFTQNRCNNPAALCYSFIKAISTKDTALFYECVEKKELKAKINETYELVRKVEENELHTIFFLKYSPWKIRQKELIKLTEEFELKCVFSINTEKIEEKNTLLIDVGWNKSENTKENSKEKIKLALRYIKNKWKIVNVQF